MAKIVGNGGVAGNDGKVVDDSAIGGNGKHDKFRWIKQYFVALTMSSLAIPIICLIITLVVYHTGNILTLPPILGIAHNSGLLAVFTGLVITVLLWIVSAFPLIKFTTAQGAAQLRFNGLRSRLSDIDSQLKLSPSESETFINLPARQEAAEKGFIDLDTLRLVYNCRNDAFNMLGETGWRWILGKGYQDVWERIHEAEAYLLQIVPTNNVVSEVNEDINRVTGSKIEGEKELLDKLSDARKTLLAFQQDTNEQKEARLDVCQVRRKLNRYREDQYNGILRTRGYYLTIALIMVYLVILLAVIRKMSSGGLLVPMGLCILGAVIGDAKCIYNRSTSDSTITTNTVDDFNLSRMYLVLLLILSGFAAVAGVVIFSFFTNLDSPIDLGQIFSISKHPIDIFYAMICGYSPDLLMSRARRAIHNIF